MCEPKLRVLFVDDEPSILRGFKAVFHRERKVWDMAFAANGAEALALMETTPIDVLVTDMRMPEMDGAQLLAEVHRRHPETCRIVLSGHSAPEAIARVLPTMHAFLAKPCEPAVMRKTIERCRRVHEVTPDPALRAIIGRVDKLPTPPALYFQLTKLMHDPRARTQDAVDLIQQDPAIAAKLLQVASSAAFGTGIASVSIERAVTYLGLEIVRSLCLSNVLCAPADVALPISPETLQAHALRTATVARACIDDRRGADLAFAAGLLHDVGRLVLQLADPAGYGQLCRTLELSGESLVEAERRVYGADHALVGACLVRMWGLADQLADVIAFHHAPGHIAPELADISAVVHVAETLANNGDATEVDLELLRTRALGSPSAGTGLALS